MDNLTNVVLNLKADTELEKITTHLKFVDGVSTNLSNLKVMSVTVHQLQLLVSVDSVAVERQGR